MFMLQLLLAVTASTAWSATAELDCRAIFRTLDEHQKGIEETASLKVTESGASAARYEAELRGKFFSVVEDRSGDLLVQITTAPEYTKGSVAKGLLDNQGRFSLSEVNGVTTHRLECRKSR